MNESVFKQAFNIAEVANFTKEQREDYEKSRLTYIGMRQVTETAEKDGVIKGLIQGKEERNIEIALIIAHGIRKAVLSLDTGIKEGGFCIFNLTVIYGVLLYRK